MDIIIKKINEIKGFENIEGYEICSNGFVISHKKQNKKILKGYKNTKGYLLVDLNKNKRAVKIHRLVALAFINNEHNKPQVNHKDGNKLNNHIDNLEWVTNSENQKHAIKNGLKKIKKGIENYQYDKEHHTCKKVLQYDLNGNFISEYVSLASAARAVNLASYSNISKVCRGIHKTASGYVWKFKENN